MRTTIDCCTKDCPDRSADPNCHTYCKRYLEQRAELDAANEERFKKSATDSGVAATLARGINKTMHRRNLYEKNKR